MNKKGQLSIEFILIVVLIIIYLNSAVFPNVEFAEETLSDVYGLSQTRLAAERIVTSINSLSLQTTNAKQTITILVPANGTIDCSTTTPTAISFAQQLQGPSAKACENDLDPANGTNCLQERATLASNLNCPGLPVTGPQQKTLVITKNASRINIS